MDQILNVEVNLRGFKNNEFSNVQKLVAFMKLAKKNETQKNPGS